MAAMECGFIIAEFAQRIRIAVAAGSDTRRPVLLFQFTKSWTVPQRSRRFGMDAERCGCAVLARLLKSKPFSRYVHHHAVLVLDADHDSSAIDVTNEEYRFNIGYGDRLSE